jgi:hypothetical protein
MIDVDTISERIMRRVAETMTDEQFAAMFSPEGLGRQAQWRTEDDWIVMYSTEKIRHGTLDGLFAVAVFKPKGRGRKRVWDRVRLDKCETRREAKQRALRFYYEHSPKAAARHGWNGNGYAN